MNQSQQQQRKVANRMRMTRNCQLHRQSRRKSESDTMKTGEMGGTSPQLPKKVETEIPLGHFGDFGNKAKMVGKNVKISDAADFNSFLKCVLVSNNENNHEQA